MSAPVEDPYGLMPDEDGDVVLGLLTAVKGLRGELRFLPGPNFWVEAFATNGLKTLSPDGGKLPVRVVRHYRSRRNFIVTLEGVSDREQAQEIVGRELILAPGDESVTLPEPPRPFQLLGMRVILEDGEELGTLVDVQSLEPHDVYEVRGAEKLYQIPAIPEVIKLIDFEARVVRIEPLPGLLEI